ncbi:MAG TPA: cytochrome c nitrite reductase small subunit [Phycisphaerales bacterium]|nr:cytochrome c nitrite reductase small subunit [Phycisphaerales bacterium]
MRARRNAAIAGLAGLALSALVGVFLGAGVYTVHHAEGLSYLSNDPRACVNCHIMREQYDGWQKGSHHAVATCNDCHVPHDLVGKYLTKVEHGYRHSKGFTFQDFHEPIRMKESSRRIVNHNCIGCHEALLAQVQPLFEEDAHSFAGGPPGAAAFDCLHCHAGVGHGPGG